MTRHDSPSTPGVSVSKVTSSLTSTPEAASEALKRRLQRVAEMVHHYRDNLGAPAVPALMEEIAVLAGLADARSVNWPLMFIRTARLVAQATEVEDKLPALLDALRNLEVEIVSWAPRSAFQKVA